MGSRSRAISKPLERYPESRIIIYRALILPVLLFGGVWVWRYTELAEEAFDTAKEGHVGEKIIIHQLQESLDAQGRPGMVHLCRRVLLYNLSLGSALDRRDTYHLQCLKSQSAVVYLV